MGTTRRRVLIGGAALVALAAGGIGLAFRRDMRRAAKPADPALSRMVTTRHGPLEYAEAGTGPALLMLHGTGGGFDQGLLTTRRLWDGSFRVIAPSRFGYLRTPLPPDAGPEAEAEAMADLLDHLGIDRVAVAGGSAGAIPALAFAAMFPERISALFPIVPALAIPGRASVEPWSPLLQAAVMAVLHSDLLFWTASRLARDQIISTVLATDPALVHAATAEEQARVGAMLDGLLPITRRVDGIFYDNTQTNRPQALRFKDISCPTLIISAEDDRFLTAENARYLASVIHGAETLILPDGGHVWVGHDAEVLSAVAARMRRIDPS